MAFAHWLVVVSALISFSGAAVYIRDTLKGKTKPNRVSWTMWALAPLLSTAIVLSAHADPWATVRIFLAGFLPLLVLLASFINPQSYWKLTKFDILCGLCSVLALIAWLIISSPQLAILLLVIGDAFAALPTLRKAWTSPETETGLTYIGSLISTLLVVPSIPKWNIENSAFQVYLIVINIILLISVYRKRLQ